MTTVGKVDTLKVQTNGEMTAVAKPIKKDENLTLFNTQEDTANNINEKGQKTYDITACNVKPENPITKGTTEVTKKETPENKTAKDVEKEKPESLFFGFLKRAIKGLPLGIGAGCIVGTVALAASLAIGLTFGMAFAVMGAVTGAIVLANTILDGLTGIKNAEAHNKKLEEKKNKAADENEDNTNKPEENKNS